jgi:hypothetical protein
LARRVIAQSAALAATGLGLGLWGALAAMQTLVSRDGWNDNGPLGWPLQRMRQQRSAVRRFGDVVWTSRGLTWLAGLQLIFALVLCLAPLPAAFAGLMAVTLLLSWRMGADGADKMALVVGAGALLQALGLAWDAPALALAGLLWTGGQLTIAYFAAGSSKALLAPWRSGAALRAALSSYESGHRGAAAALRVPRVAAAAAWTIIAIEVAFPLALLLPAPGLAVVLAGFFAFHVAIAVVMGLNTYPLAFAAAYPSVLLLSQWLRGMLGLA